jgi:hypothetical protein
VLMPKSTNSVNINRGVDFPIGLESPL